jgi:hypothetical protein
MALVSNTGTLTITAPNASLPSWYPTSAGTVVTVPTGGTTALSAALAAGSASYPGSTSLTAEWSGGVIVYISGQPYLIVEGGGHNTSSWNGIVKLGPLSGAGSSSPTWSIFLAASSVGSVVRNTAAYTDGKQSASHTYNSLAAAPSGSVYYSTQTAPYGDGGWVEGAFVKSTSGQTRLATNPMTGQQAAAGYFANRIFTIGGSSSFDRLRIYNIAANTWSSESGSDIAFSGPVSMAIDTSRGAAFVVNSSSGVYWSGLSGTPTRTTGKTGPGTWVASMEYDADRDVFVSCLDGSLTVRELSASSLAAGGNPSWTNRVFTGSTPSAAEPAGTFGRFRYIPALKGYILLPSQSSSVYFYRAT